MTLKSSKPVYRHETDPELFLSFTRLTNEWRITTLGSIAKQSSFCMFKETNGILHNPSKFSATTLRSCFIGSDWVDTDLVIMAAPESGLKVRRLGCDGNSSSGQLRAVIQGIDWQFDVNLNDSSQIDEFANFGHTFDEIISVDTVTTSDSAFCLSEFTISTPEHAINLILTQPRGEIKPTKKSGKWPQLWWDGSTFGKGEDEVTFDRQFILPKSVQVLQPSKSIGLMGKQVSVSLSQLRLVSYFRQMGTQLADYRPFSTATLASSRKSTVYTSGLLAGSN